MYTSIQPANDAGDAPRAREIVLVFESYNLSNILILTVHSCYNSWYTSSVHLYLRSSYRGRSARLARASILTAGVPGLVLSWLGLYSSIQPANAARAREIVLVLVFESYNLSNTWCIPRIRGFDPIILRPFLPTVYSYVGRRRPPLHPVFILTLNIHTIIGNRN